MKVLHVIPSLTPESGGPGTSIPPLCRALAEAGIEITLYAGHTPGDLLTIVPEKEPYRVKLFSTAAGRLYAGYSMYREIRARKGEFDLIDIHSIWNPIATLVAAASRTAGIPYVLSPHGMLSNVSLQRRRRLKRLSARLYERRTVEGAACLRFLSRAESRDSHVDWFKYPGHFCASNGVDLSLGETERGAFRRRFPQLAGRRVMLFLGRLHPLKGLDLQLEALRRLVGKYPDLCWVLVGPDNGEWQRLSGLVRAAGLESNVMWLGQIVGAERFTALADADVVLMSSFYEGRSMTINEALAVGAPLVVTDTVNFNELEEAGAGLVVTGRDPSKYAGAVDSILSAPERSQSMRLAGRRFAAQELDWSRIAANMKLAFEEILSGASSGVTG
jgi:glycosyltransferase involved in cell wall biosynthesis